MAQMPLCPTCSKNDKVTCSIDPIITTAAVILHMTVRIAAWPVKAGFSLPGVTYFCSRDGNKWTMQGDSDERKSAHG